MADNSNGKFMAAQSEYAIVFTGYVATRKTISILDEKRKELSERYPVRYLKSAEKRLKEEAWNSFDATEAFEKLYGSEGSIVIPCLEDGVFAALWRLGEALDSGLNVKQDCIPIDQASIELCDWQDINPYEADCTGSFLLAVVNPGEIVEKLEKQGISAKVIGYTTKENARTVDGASKRFLTRP